MNRLATVDYPDTSLNVTLAYDGGTNQKGRLTTMVDGSGTTTFGYDAYGNVSLESKLIDGNTHVTAYTYDAADLVTQVIYPSGRTVDFTRNVLGQVTQVDTTYDTTTQAVASSLAYEPFGPLSGLTFGNGLVMDRVFDQQYRLTNQTTGLIQDLTFSLDAAGNIDAITDAVTPSLSQTFGQDVLHRIDSDTGGYGTKSYTYDGVGNRLTRTHGAVTQTLTYTTNSNRLTTHDGLAVTLDLAGNTTADVAQDLSFSYGDHNRMVSASVGSVTQANYTYNGQGQRVKKVETTGPQRTFIFHFALNGELIGETVYDDLGAKVEERDYIWLDLLPLAQLERVFSGGTIIGSSFTYLHTDQLRTPRLGSESSGTIVWRWDSDAFGLGDADSDPDSDMNYVDVRLRFPGQYVDEETNLNYNNFRDYDRTTGRYVESDAIGLDGGLNTFSYVSQNPVVMSDPLGLQAARGFYPFPGGGGSVLRRGLGQATDGNVRRQILEILRQIDRFRGSLGECEVGYYTACIPWTPSLLGDIIQLGAYVQFGSTLRDSESSFRPFISTGTQWSCEQGKVVGRIANACCLEQEKIPWEDD